MLKLSEIAAGRLTSCSPTFPESQLAEILSVPGVYHAPGHFLYPVSDGERKGNHLSALFLIEPLAASDKYVSWIVDDMVRWLERENIQFDVVFAPAQPAVVKIASQLANRTGHRVALWEYETSGWFGKRLVEGTVARGDKVLVLNGVTQQGRCVGSRLPELVEASGGDVVAAAVFAKSTASGVRQAEERYGSRLYCAVRAEIDVSPPADCRLCHDKVPGPVPWTEIRDRQAALAD